MINIRIASGTNSSGRVEIQDASNDTNPWGTICDDRWDNKAASVTCRQLGYQWGVSFFLFVHFMIRHGINYHCQYMCHRRILFFQLITLSRLGLSQVNSDCQLNSDNYLNCLFHNLIIGIKHKLIKQTVKILMRRPISHLDFQTSNDYYPQHWSHTG